MKASEIKVVKIKVLFDLDLRASTATLAHRGTDGLDGPTSG